MLLLIAPFSVVVIAELLVSSALLPLPKKKFPVPFNMSNVVVPVSVGAVNVLFVRVSVVVRPTSVSVAAGNVSIPLAVALAIN